MLMPPQMSLGSAMWTTEPEKVWTILNILIDEGIPFVSSIVQNVVNI